MRWEGDERDFFILSISFFRLETFFFSGEGLLFCILAAIPVIKLCYVMYLIVLKLCKIKILQDPGQSKGQYTCNIYCAYQLITINIVKKLTTVKTSFDKRPNGMYTALEVMRRDMGSISYQECKCFTSFNECFCVMVFQLSTHCYAVLVYLLAILYIFSVDLQY